MRIKLLEECIIKNAIKKHEDLQKKCKEVVRGIVPTKRGYATRAKNDAEAAAIVEVNPEEARRLGPARAVKMTASWASQAYLPMPTLV